MKLYLLVIPLLVVSLVCPAQVTPRPTLSGRVVDKSTSESLPSATVRIEGTGLATQTNADGFFTLLDVPYDGLTVLVSCIGFQVHRQNIPTGGELNGLVIGLQTDMINLNEVSVTGKKQQIVSSGDEIGLIRLAPRNLSKLPNAGERDIFRALQLMPGVSAANESSAGLYIRGGTPDQTLVLFDGFTVYHLEHLYGFFSAFNYNTLKDVELYKGGFDARYGGRLSGVAELTGKEGSRKSFNAGIDASLLSLNAFIESPLGKKVTFLIAGRRSFKGPIYNKIFDQFQTEPTRQQPTGRLTNQLQTSQKVSSYFYDLNGRVTFRSNEKEQLTLSFYNGQDYLDNSQQINIPAFGNLAATGNALGSTDLSDWGNTGSSLKWSRRWGQKVYTNTLVSYSNYFSHRNASSTISLSSKDNKKTDLKYGTIENNDLKDVTVKTNLEFKISEQHQLEAGYQWTQTRIDYTFNSNDTLTLLEKNDKGSTFSVYVQDQVRFLDNKLILKPGVRMTYYDMNRQLYSEPRFSASYQLTEQLKLKGAWGNYFQFIRQIAREDLSQGNRNFWLLSNANELPVGKAEHFIAGMLFETAGYLFDAEAYAKNLDGLTEYTLRYAPKTGEGLVPQQTFFAGTGTVRGIDLLVQKKYGKYTGWMGYTYAVAKNHMEGYSDKDFYANQDTRHELKWINTFSTKKFDFALTWVYASGKPYTSVLGEYSVRLLDGTYKTFANPSAKNAMRFPDYHRMDLSVTYNFKNGSIGASVFNLYNRENIWYKKYTSVSDGQTSRLLVNDVVYLGITPNLTFSYHLH